MLALQPVTVRNWEQAAKLEVASDQAAFIETNLWSIAESQFYKDLRPMVIYRGGAMVGFLMWGLGDADRQPWLYRFMIDRRFQRQGYGREAIRRLLELVRNQGHTQLNVGFARENTIAEHLYLSEGFQSTGLANWGEKTARIDLRARP